MEAFETVKLLLWILCNYIGYHIAEISNLTLLIYNTKRYTLMLNADVRLVPNLSENGMHSVNVVQCVMLTDTNEGSCPSTPLITLSHLCPPLRFRN